jgi:hypothetical protein
MKTSYVTAAAVVVSMLAASTALAGTGATKTEKSRTSTDPSSASQPAASPSTSSGVSGSSSDWSGRHTMEGEVARIDQQKGTMSVKTSEGTLDLHFPPSALSNVKKGDRVSVELALKPEGGAASPATEKPSSMPGGSSSGASKSGSGSSKY